MKKSKAKLKNKLVSKRQRQYIPPTKNINNRGRIDVNENIILFGKIFQQIEIIKNLPNLAAELMLTADLKFLHFTIGKTIHRFDLASKDLKTVESVLHRSKNKGD